MKRQSSDLESLVYAYGCGAPISGWQAALKEAEGCRAMWDRLVLADRSAEERLRALAAAAQPEIAAQLADIERLTIALDHAETPEQRQNWRNERRILWRTVHAAVRDWAKQNKPAADGVEEQRRKDVVHIRQNSGLYWGNYNRVLESYDRSRKLCRTMGRRLRMSDPEREDGCLTVQIQRTRSGLGASPAELQRGGFSGVQLGRVAPDQYIGRCETTRQRRTIVEMRVNAAGDMIRLPIWYHRDLPADARVKSAQLTWWRVGVRMRYQLALTITRPRPQRQPEGAGTAEVEFVPLRREGDAATGCVARCGDWVLQMPQKWHEQMDRVAHLTAVIQDTTELVWAQRSPRARLLQRWKSDLPQLRSNLQDQRKHLYLNWAKRLAQTYATIILPETDLAALAKGEEETPAQREMRKRACLHLLESSILHMARKHGAMVIRRDAASGDVVEQPGMSKIKRKRMRQKALKNSARSGAGSSAPDQ